MKYRLTSKRSYCYVSRTGGFRDPFIGFKLTGREVRRPFLTENELQESPPKNFRLGDLPMFAIFLFSCFAGLAYADVK